MLRPVDGQLVLPFPGTHDEYKVSELLGHADSYLRFAEMRIQFFMAMHTILGSALHCHRFRI